MTANGAPSEEQFELFSALRYDPVLVDSTENSSKLLSFKPDSPFYMLAYHRDRMMEAARHFNWESVIKQLQDGDALESILASEVEKYQSKQEGQKTPLKVRVLFNSAGEMQVDMAPVPPVPLTALYPQSLSTSSKPKPEPVQDFKPSPLTGGALNLGPTDSLPTPDPSWHLHMDTEPTPATPYTSLKTTRRAHYNASRARALPPPSQQDSKIHEVMLFNTCNEMTEGSLTSLYFYRGGQWVTPPVGSTPTSVHGTDASTEAGSKGGEQSAAPQETDGSNSGEGDHLPSFPGRWGHSLRSSTKWPDSGGQRGTTRRWALRRGLCMEEIVEKNSVEVGELVWVSNGVRGFHLGKVVG